MSNREIILKWENFRIFSFSDLDLAVSQIGNEIEDKNGRFSMKKKCYCISPGVKLNTDLRDLRLILSL